MIRWVWGLGKRKMREVVRVYFYVYYLNVKILLILRKQQALLTLLRPRVKVAWVHIIKERPQKNRR